MEIFDLLHRDCVAVGLDARSKDDALMELARLVHNSPHASTVSQEAIYERLKAREEKGTTGLGDGVAIPHSAVEGLEHFVVALAVSRKGVPFKSLDNKKVNVFAVIVGPEGQPKQHIKLLAQISHVFRVAGVRSRLIDSPTPLALYEGFMSRCRPKDMAGGDRSKKQKVVVLVVQTEKLFDEVMEVLADLGVAGASVIQSSGMRSTLSRMPLFADFIHFFGDHSDNSRTLIFTVYENSVEEVLQEIEEVTGDLDVHSGVIMMVLEPWLIKGSLELI